MLIQYVLVATLIAALALTWRRVRQGALSRVTAMLWSLLWIAAGLLVTRPEFSSVFAKWLGVGRGVDAVIYIAIVVLYYLVFRIFLKLDKLDRDLTIIVRHIGLENFRAAAGVTRPPSDGKR